jgi:hypothetical protein
VHEVDRYFTTFKSTAGKVFFLYRERVNADHEETRVWRWAANCLTPDAMVEEFLLGK